MSRVQSIERAFAVLGALAGGPLGVTEVAERVDLPKSTAARLLSSLSREGAVEQVPGESRYRLGGGLVDLAAGVHPSRSLAPVARPMLVELAASVSEAAGLSVPEGDSAHYIDQVDTPNPVSVRDWTGARLPLHAVSSGQVFLAHRSEAALERYLARPLERFTPHTLVTAEAVRDRVRMIRRDGYAWVREEYEVGVSSVAVPIADTSGEVVAAIHLHGPIYRFPVAGSEARVAERVVAAAARIAANLRGAG